MYGKGLIVPETAERTGSSISYVSTIKFSYLLRTLDHIFFCPRRNSKKCGLHSHPNNALPPSHKYIWNVLKWSTTGFDRMDCVHWGICEDSKRLQGTGAGVISTAVLAEIHIKSSFGGMKILCSFLKRSRQSGSRKNMQKIINIFWMPKNPDFFLDFEIPGFQ